MSTWLALAHMMENGASINFMVGTSKRIKKMLRRRKNKSSTNQEKEKRKVSLRKRSTCPSLSVIIVAKMGILHVTAKSLGN